MTEDCAAEKERAAKSLLLEKEKTQYESDIKVTKVTTETQCLE